jgi:hypothetical protein
VGAVSAAPNAPAAPLLGRALVRAGLSRFGAATPGDAAGAAASLGALLGTGDDWDAACEALARRAPELPGAWGRLLRDYRLQLHEWFAVALCGEVETAQEAGDAVAALQSSGPRPTLHLVEALAARLFGAALPPLRWATHPLVRGGVVELAGEGPLPSRALLVRPELWALLCGDRTPWREARPIADAGAAALPASLDAQLVAAAGMLRRGAIRVVVLRGAPQVGLAAAARLAAALGLAAVEVPAAAWEARPALATACRYAGWLPVVPLALGAGDRHAPGHEALHQTPLVLVAGRDGTIEAADALELPVLPLSGEERRAAWERAVPAPAAAELAAQALVDGPTIRALADRVLLEAARAGEPPGAAHLRAARAAYGAERLRLLAQPVARGVGPDALVLAAPVQRQFDALVRRCRMRERLWDGLGPSLSQPTPGVRALFCGESGAGKTLAASRLATVLGAPLYRVDLAAVMNKYVGETEKNLGLLLDEAAALDAMLLVDEADALFGRRGEGRDGTDRFANMLTNYLLTRFEAHPGIVVLTTNARSRLDAAFTRRFDAVVEFPTPGVEERYRLWQAHLGARSPGERLCRLLSSYSDLPGGHIRNAVVSAVARSERPAGEPVEAAALVAGLREEYRALGRPPPPQLDHITG